MLLEAVRSFYDLDVATGYVARLHWPDGLVCPKRGVLHEKHYYPKTRRVWKCRACKKRFSVKVGTIFKDSPVGRRLPYSDVDGRRGPVRNAVGDMRALPASDCGAM